MAAEETLGMPLKRKSIGFFHRLMDILDRPGNATRALLVGKLGGLKGLIPFAQSIENLTGLDVAMNESDLVAGTEVIEKYFGKQKQRKGKFDLADVLGFAVEVIADPLWLTGVGGLTRAGRAAKLTQSAQRGVVAAVKAGMPGAHKSLLALRKTIKAARAGKLVGDNLKLAKAFRTVYQAGTKPVLAKTWAKQVATGQRALLKFAGKPFIKGEKVFEKVIEPAAKALKMGGIGKIFLAPTRRVPPQYKELHDIYTHFARDLPAVQRASYLKRLQGLYTKGAKTGLSADKMDELVRSFVQREYATAEPFKALVVGKRGKKVAREVKGLHKKLLGIDKKLQSALKPLPMRKGKVVSPEIANKWGRLYEQWTKIPNKKSPEAWELALKVAAQRELYRKALLKEIPKKPTRYMMGKHAGIISAYKQQLANIDRQINYWKNIYGKGLKRTKEGLFPIAKIQKVEEIAAKRGKEAKELLAGLPPEQAKALKGLSKEYAGLHKEFIAKELAAGVPAKQIMYPIGYARRVPTEEFRKFLEAHKHRPVIAGFMRDLSARNPAQRMRNKVLGMMTDDEALKYFKELGFKGKSVFEPGMAGPAFQRAAMSAKSVGAAETITQSLKKFGRLPTDYYKGKGFTTLTDDIIREVGLDIANPKIKTLLGKVVPDDVGNALREWHKLATSEDALTGFWRTWTGIQRYMKGAFTMPWPAYHSRNMLSNFVLNWIGNVKNPKVYFNALAIQRGGGVPIKTAMGVLNPEDIMRYADEWGIVRRALGMVSPAEIGLAPQMGKAKGAVARHLAGRGALRRGGARVGMAIEDNARLAHFIDKLQKGFNFQDAAASAKKVLFDYGDLSRIEKRYFRDRGIFFYTFMRKNLALQAETVLKQPGKMAFWSHVMGGTPTLAKEEQHYPDWWRERLVTRPLWTTKKGEEVRIAGAGMPIEEAFGSFAGPGYGFWDRLARIAGRQYTKLSPLITTPTEAITGKDIYYGKEVADLGYAPEFMGKLPKLVKKPLAVQKVKREGKPAYYTMSPRAAFAIRKSPLSRMWSSASMISRRGQPWWVTAPNILLGQKPRIYDPERMRELAEKREIEALLKEQFRRGKIRKFKRFYQPKGFTDEKMDLLLKMQ